jgi:tRNA-specific 2-thiouridylase
VLNRKKNKVIFVVKITGLIEMNNKVLLGMSGGIDSSVAAILLQEQGYEVVGVTLRLWSETDGFHNQNLPAYAEEARALAQKLGIQHKLIDARKPFYEEVISYFKNEYQAGRTPNPCAKCNVVLKWKLLNQAAEAQGCEYIATGHYANKESHNKLHYLSKGADPDKEQSFFLWGLNQAMLQKTLFPLGKLSKQEVRNIAKERGFTRLEAKKESIGACFIKSNNYHGLLKQLLAGEGIELAPGAFIDGNGKQLGQHQGYPFYTVGQRRGLGLSPNEPWYVTKIIPDTNQVVLGKRDDLYQTQMLVKDYHLINPEDFKQEVITRIRYRKQAAPSRIEILDKQFLKVYFTTREWSIAPGQTAAFYQGNRLLGGGFIVS